MPFGGVMGGKDWTINLFLEDSVQLSVLGNKKHLLIRSPRGLIVEERKLEKGAG